MQRVLIANHLNTYFTGLLPLALMLKQSSQFEPVVLFSRVYPTALADIITCKQQSLEVHLGKDVNKVLLPEIVKNKIMIDGKHNKYEILLKSPLILINRVFTRIFTNGFLLEIMKIYKKIRNIRQLIRTERISLIVLPANNRYDFSVFVHAAHQEKIGVVLVPQFMAGPLEWAEHVKDKRSYQSKNIVNRLAGYLFPKWSLQYKGRKLLALPGAQIFAHELFGIAPPSPWVLHSGMADAVAVESDAIRSYCLKEGLPSEKIHVTGSITQDHMFRFMSDTEQKRTILNGELGFALDQPLILSALPCDMLYTNRTECDFQEYEKLLEFWCKTISSIEGYNHVVALHPSVCFDDMKYIEKFGLKIIKESTASIIPLCDIYVASISSTIQWAIACCKPVINYDVYRYHYTDYQNAEGVITIYEQKDFLYFLKKLTSDYNYLSKITNKQLESKKNWGIIDGMASERLKKLFDSIIKCYQEAV